MLRRVMLLLVAFVLVASLGLCGCGTHIPAVADVLGVWYIDLLHDTHTGIGWQSPEDQAQPGDLMTTYFMVIMNADGTFETRFGILNEGEWPNADGTWEADGVTYILTDDQDPPSIVRMWFQGGRLFGNEGSLSYRLSRDPAYWPTA